METQTGKSFRLCILLCATLISHSATATPPLPSTTPQSYSVQRTKQALTLKTPYYAIEHDLTRGGVISGIRLTHGSASNILAQPIEIRIQDAAGNIYTDRTGKPARVNIRHDGLTEFVTIEGDLMTPEGHKSGIHAKKFFQYRWGYIKVHEELTFPTNGFQAKDVTPVSTAFAPSLAAYGYRDGLTEDEGAPPFSFGSCHWGTVKLDSTAAFETAVVPHYVMLANPGVEGIEWFVSSDLAQWDLQLTGKRGKGKCLLSPTPDNQGIAFSVSPFHSTSAFISLPKTVAFDYYIGVPILEGHATKPWFHTSFNRNNGAWVSTEQIRSWAESGIQTVHCHNDGDAFGDGLFWRDGSYPPYPDMDCYDKVIADCRGVGIQTATYFSNKELHPITPEFQNNGTNWGRMNRKGELQHNAFNDKSEFGAQMCLRSGWLDYFKLSVDRVLTNHHLNGVYYDWNVALLCCNSRHEKLNPGQKATGHWDIDELLDLMEWTRRRVGPQGLIIVHNTTTPMFATENFADHVVANEWGYGKWSDKGPSLQELPLEWSLVGARSRGVISYGQIDANAPMHLHRLFALEALLAGVTPWTASKETFELYRVLKPIGDVEQYRFADWRNEALTTTDVRCAAAVYSHKSEAWIVIGNLDPSTKEVSCTLRPEKLPYPLPALNAVTFLATGKENSETALDPARLKTTGVRITIPAESAVLLHVR